MYTYSRISEMITEVLQATDLDQTSNIRTQWFLQSKELEL